VTKCDPLFGSLKYSPSTPLPVPMTGAGFTVIVTSSLTVTAPSLAVRRST